MGQFIRANRVESGDFDGTSGQGSFDFTQFYLLDPVDELLIIDKLSFCSDAAATVDFFLAYFVPPSGEPGNPILIGSTSGTLATDGFGIVACTYCPGLVPRAANQIFWQIKCYSQALSGPCGVVISGRSGKL